MRDERQTEDHRTGNLGRCGQLGLHRSLLWQPGTSADARCDNWWDGYATPERF